MHFSDSRLMRARWGVGTPVLYLFPPESCPNRGLWWTLSESDVCRRPLGLTYTRRAHPDSTPRLAGYTLLRRWGGRWCQGWWWQSGCCL